MVSQMKFAPPEEMKTTLERLANLLLILLLLLQMLNFVYDSQVFSVEHHSNGYEFLIDMLSFDDQAFSGRVSLADHSKSRK
jgi:hypothetical protein